MYVKVNRRQNSFIILATKLMYIATKFAITLITVSLLSSVFVLPYLIFTFANSEPIPIYDMLNGTLHISYIDLDPICFLKTVLVFEF